MSAFQCSCSRCGVQKTARQSNMGWWEMKPRGPHSSTTHWFCPKCSATLMVAVDGALEGKSVEAHRVVSADLLGELASFLEMMEARRVPATMFGLVEALRLKRLAMKIRALVDAAETTVR